MTSWWNGCILICIKNVQMMDNCILKNGISMGSPFRSVITGCSYGWTWEKCILTLLSKMDICFKFPS